MSSFAISAIDFFCGAGGLTRGLLDSGINVIAGIDLNESCRYAYCHNNKVKFIGKSIENVSGSEIANLLGGDNHAAENRNFSLLCGCAPCQTFSTMNQKDEQKRMRDKRWGLLNEFSRLINSVLPDFVTMENVPGISKTDVFREFIKTLENNGYHFDYRIVDCSEYGMPQKRTRLVLIASRLGKITIPDPSDLNLPQSTVRSAIGSLPPINAGETCASDPLHVSSSLSETNLKRMRGSIPGGTWRDWNDDLVLKCHTKTEGDGYTAVYGRMEWDDPSPTITTQFYNYGSGRFGHPEQDRALSLREGAILQGFPKDYVFCDPQNPIGKRKIGMMIGNAVPVGLAKIIGQCFVSHAETFAKRDEPDTRSIK